MCWRQRLIALLVIVGGAAAGCTDPSPGPAAHGQRTTTTAAPPLVLGRETTVQVDATGGRLEAAVIAIKDPAPAPTGRRTPEGRFLAVHLRLSNAGWVSAFIDVLRDVEVVDHTGARHRAIAVAASGAGLPADRHRLVPRESRQGAVVFDVPKATVVERVDVTLRTAFGETVGRWVVPRPPADAPRSGDVTVTSSTTTTVPSCADVDVRSDGYCLNGAGQCIYSGDSPPPGPVPEACPG